MSCGASSDMKRMLMPGYPRRTQRIRRSLTVSVHDIEANKLRELSSPAPSALVFAGARCLELAWTIYRLITFASTHDPASDRELLECFLTGFFSAISASTRERAGGTGDDQRPRLHRATR